MTTPTPPLVIDFDEAAHTYRVNGEVWPSVTTILRAAGLINFDGVPDYILRGAQARGTRVHKAAHYLTEGTLDWSSVSDEDRGYVEAAARFIADAKFEVCGQERRLAHGVHRYAGTCDIVGWWHGAYAVGDFKTGNPADVAADLQLAAYAEALRYSPVPEWFDVTPAAPIQRVSIRLSKDGRYSAELYTSPRDFSLFLACLTVVREQERRGKNRKVAA
jgi:hypothetical protein